MKDNETPIILSNCTDEKRIKLIDDTTMKILSKYIRENIIGVPDQNGFLRNGILHNEHRKLVALLIRESVAFALALNAQEFTPKIGEWADEAI